MLNVAEGNQWRWWEESGQWLENVDQTHLFMAAGKPLLQKSYDPGSCFRSSATSGSTPTASTTATSTSRPSDPESWSCSGQPSLRFQLKSSKGFLQLWTLALKMTWQEQPMPLPFILAEFNYCYEVKGTWAVLWRGNEMKTQKTLGSHTWAIFRKV